MSIQGSLADALARGVVVLDGGMSNELAADGHDLSDALWSARLLRDEPAAVRAVHRRYFAAGAQVAITASYQASFEGFARVGLDRAEAEELLRRSVTLAREAADELPDGVPNAGPDTGSDAGPDDVPGQGRRWVAASVGPYGAVLADGSEYRGRYGLSRAQLRAFHAPRAEVLASARPDVLAIETIPDIDEAEAALDAVSSLDVPVWLSFSAADGSTRAGQPLAEAFALAHGNAQVVAVGVNCLAPEEAADAVALAAEVSGKPVVVYPNSGEGWDAAARAWSGPATFSPDRVAEWTASGARLVGGCCRVGADQIAALAQGIRVR
ncbi:homocysteine S-methyltransferase [Streptacidiphilus fuscans]|uniref:Homocysteine S-methyltransferase n=1 Tax=Streptacidiphilus fuscans TaxID=2789292 RepID=A0A931FGS3_9ACTN|nr:homocysteine S-methyltransferase [Streptacidiphilus fuscans]MBF9069889.1 homocysteine S-methyltransferase [Streptacidiphilus fuscans]